MGTQPRWVHTPRMMRNFGSLTRSSSLWASRSSDRGTLRSFSISASVLWRMNRGFPLHLKTIFFPSGMSASLTSIFARARVAADAPQFDEHVNQAGGAVSAHGSSSSHDEIIEGVPVCLRVLALLVRVLRGVSAVRSEIRHWHVSDMGLTSLYVCRGGCDGRKRSPRNRGRGRHADRHRVHRGRICGPEGGRELRTVLTFLFKFR